MPNPIIETKRLIIRPPKSGDEVPLNQAVNRSIQELTRWMPWAHEPSLETTAKHIQDAIKQWQSPNQTDFPMVVLLKTNNQIIAGSGFNDKSNPEVPFYEIGYWIDTQYTGMGFATELTCALTHHAFTVMKAIRVQICTQADNIKSIRVAEKSGFTLEARLHNYRLDCSTGNPVDELIFACFGIKNLPDNF